MTAWTQLDSDGVLSGGASGSVQVPRAVTAITEQGGVLGAGIVTPDGTFAASTLSSNDGYAGLSGGVAIAPAGGTLVSHGPIGVSDGGTTIDGGLRLFSRFNPSRKALDILAGASLTTTASVASYASEVRVAGALTTPRFAQHGYGVEVADAGHLYADTLVLTGRTTFKIGAEGSVATSGSPEALEDGNLYSMGGCSARIHAPLVLSADSLVDGSLDPSTLQCAPYVVNGPVTLSGTLFLNAVGSHVGDRHVVMRSAAGISGTFSKLDEIKYGRNHWEVSYTRTQVIATLVAGHA